MYLWSLICLAMASGVFAGCGGSQKGPPFSVETAKTSPVAGIQDDTVGKPGQDPTERLRKMAESGASLVRVDLLWSEVAPTRPANPADPQDPAYRWQAYDRVLDVAKANKLEVMFAVYGTPKWARDPTVTLPAQEGRVRFRGPAEGPGGLRRVRDRRGNAVRAPRGAQVGGVERAEHQAVPLPAVRAPR